MSQVGGSQKRQEWGLAFSHAPVDTTPLMAQCCFDFRAADNLVCPRPFNGRRVSPGRRPALSPSLSVVVAAAVIASAAIILPPFVFSTTAMYAGFGLQGPQTVFSGIAWAAGSAVASSEPLGSHLEMASIPVSLLGTAVAFVPAFLTYRVPGERLALDM